MDVFLKPVEGLVSSSTSGDDRLCCRLKKVLAQISFKENQD